jgi:hypothetical protein
MKFTTYILGSALVLLAGAQAQALARGFGAARGGFAAGPHGAVAGGARFGAGVGPAGGAYAGGARAGAAVGPYGGYHAGGARGGSYVGPRGTTVQAGRAGGVAVGPFGGVHAAGAEGARVTTPGGRTFATGSAGRAGVGPAGGVYAGGWHGAAAGGPFGTVAASYRGGVRIGAGGAVVAGGAVGHATRFVSPNAFYTQAGFVRGGFYRPVFTPTWFGAHPAAWFPGRWVVPNIWAAPVWPAVSTWCGVSAPPIPYDYGSNVVINDDYVYVDGQQSVPADQYAQQAAQFADVGRQAQPTKDEEWQSLGVFGLVQGDEKTAQNIFQLAVNKGGVIRGNYYDAVADNTLPVYGSVDPKTQRAAWSIGEKKNVVFEAGLNNLTQPQTTVLVHYGTERTEQMALVRLQQPADKQ